MKVHCPRCRAETELANSVADSGVTCDACQAVFDPRKKDTLPAAGADPAGAGPELLPGIRAGEGFAGYVLERKLGRGGMGVVFAATQLSLGRRVALKVLAHELLDDPEFVQRFDREARVLASLNHANIVQVIDKGIERGNVFLVMELVDGVSLRDLLAEKKLSPLEALKIVPQLCDALEYAHARGVVHRDIKPENILIARDGSVKIADFGLARIVGEAPSGRITRSNAVMGSLDYMAPEQRERTKTADHRADIYAMGVVFYEMLTGELPLGRFEPPSKKVKLDVDVDEVVLRVLAKDP
ncbi:MAG TPA: protein kinase, partial [Planctomycetota bacterium]|nr:protein kinase [Planctomycetota bacterium]